MSSHVDEQRDEDKEVGAVIDGIFNESCFNLSNSGESSRPCIRLHEGQQQPVHTEI